MTRAIWLMGIMICTPLAVSAADEGRFSYLEQEVRRLQQQVTAMSRRIDQLERPVATAPGAPAPANPAPAPNSDAWIDAFTDSGWHGGGTNYKGFGVGGEYAFVDNATLGLRYFSTRELDDGVRFTSGSGQVGNMSSAPLRIDTVQVEANLRF
jgi:hypothetical protein